MPSTTVRTSAGAYADRLTSARNRRRKTAYTTASVLGIGSAFAVQAGEPGMLLGAFLAVPAAAAALFAHGLRRPGPAEIRQRKGDEGERLTMELLRPLTAQGWHVLHDVLAPHGGNIDHLAISPCGTLVVVLDSKRWRRDSEVSTNLGNKALRCGQDNRTDEVHKLRNLAHQVGKTLSKGTSVRVVPLMVIHGATVVGGRFQVWTEPSPIAVTGPDTLLPYLRWMAEEQPDPAKAELLAARVQTAFPAASTRKDTRRA